MDVNSYQHGQLNRLIEKWNGRWRRSLSNLVDSTTSMFLLVLCVFYFILFYSCRYSPSQRADIGRYAAIHGTAAASRFFTRKLQMNVSETTVSSIKKAYKGEKRMTEDDDVWLLPPKKRGRPLVLGERLDAKVQLYLQKVREHGGIISSRIAMAAATGILQACNRSQLVENGGHIRISRNWAYSMLSRMNYVKRKATTSKSKYSDADFAERKTRFLSDLNAIFTMEEIPIELVLNWDQTGIHIVPSSSWTLDVKGVNRVEITGTNDKRQITAVLCGSAIGEFLPPQIIYKVKVPPTVSVSK